MSINIERLRELTEKGKQLVAKEGEVQKSREELEREARENIEKEEAKRVINEIPKKAQEAAKRGFYSAQIMNLGNEGKYIYFNTHLQQNRGDRVDLGGAAKIVYDYCEENGLTPKIDSHYSSIYATGLSEYGTNYWISINWEPTK